MSDTPEQEGTGRGFMSPEALKVQDGGFISSSAPLTFNESEKKTENSSSQDSLASHASAVKAKTKSPVTRVFYHGKAGKLMRLHIANLFLNIVTLGIYSFWGKTRIRKYMTSHMVLGKDRLEYTGTGKELMFGMLKAIFILGPLFALVAFGAALPLVQFLAIPVMFGMIYTAVYLALRYRLSRTRWRSIRFSLGGSAWRYLKISSIRAFMNAITFGFAIPKSDLMKWAYIADNMKFGDMPFTFTFQAGSGKLYDDESGLKHLKKVNLVTGLIAISAVAAAIMPMLILGIKAGMAASAAEKAGLPPPTFDTMVTGAEQLKYTILIYVGMGVAIISRLWYRAALWQEQMRGLRLGGLRFKMKASGLDFAMLQITNILIIVFTLGLGKPIASHRTLGFLTQNILIGGDLKKLVAAQEARQKTSGFGDALSVDSGLDIGM
jgi:uncharacterized membrane protein YjgN (DUF898 family)